MGKHQSGNEVCFRELYALAHFFFGVHENKKKL